MVLLPACSLKDAAQRMSLELIQVRIHGFSNEGFSATVYLRVNNPNRFSVTVADLTYHAYIKDVEVGNGRLERPLEIPAEGSVVAELPIKVWLGSLGDDLPGLIRSKPDYRVTGEIKLETWFASYTLPFDTKRHKKENKEQI